jgi:site-specific recombinase XerD
MNSAREKLFSGTVPVDEVIEFYLETNPWDVQSTTISSYRTRLRHFQQFCEEQDIKDLSKIQPSHTDEYHNYLRKKPQLTSRKSIKG